MNDMAPINRPSQTARAPEGTPPLPGGERAVSLASASELGERGEGVGPSPSQSGTPSPQPSPHRGEGVLRRVSDLADAGLIPAADIAALNDVAARYVVAITPAMADLIDPADPDDPIARQFVPDARELKTTPDERVDPIGDDVHEVVPGLVHRYPDRVLLKLLTACVVYCRFCFRRETVGQGEGLSPAALDAILAYIRAHPEVWEVIISGGDPLVLSPRRLSAVVADIAAVPHVRILRIHTRVPVVAPERVTSELIAAIKDSRLSTWVAVHANHPRELTAEARAALARLADAGIALVSQTVFLKGINDNAEILEELMRGFVEARVKPYYLHHPDMAPGTAHFRGKIEEGQAIVAALRGRLSGIAQPTYVLDIPDGYGKVPIGPTYVESDPETGGITVRDTAGREHGYAEDGAAPARTASVIPVTGMSSEQAK